MGKLYINYPMVESFYYMKSIPDKDYNSYDVFVNDLIYFKELTSKLCRNKDYKKYAINIDECREIITSNLGKALYITGLDSYSDKAVLLKQCNYFLNDKKIYILCSCVFYVVDYNPKLLTAKKKFF